MQTAYLKASQLYDWPVDVTIGRQPLTLGDGFILSDDDLGFTGLRMQARLPIWDLRADTFWMRTGSTLEGSDNADVYGLEFTKPMHNVRIQASVVNERDATGQTQFIRPSEIPTMMRQARISRRPTSLKRFMTPAWKRA